VSEKNKRRLVGSFVVVALFSLGAFLAVSFFDGGGPATAGGAAQVALADVGRFRVGSAGGVERSSFTGCPFVYVFLSPDDPDYAAVEAALKDARVATAMTHFTGVLIDTRDTSEDQVEEAWRKKGWRVLVRSLGGPVLGGFKDAFSAEDLAQLLESIRRDRPKAFLGSPLYGLLKNLPEAIDRVVERQGRAKAEWYVGLMEEIEGSGDPGVGALKARLGI
jgi:hypothetical protein